MSGIGNNWQYETGPVLIPRREIEGTVKRLPNKQGKLPKWKIRITNTKTNSILEELIITARDTDSAIDKANELARTWRKKEDGNI